MTDSAAPRSVPAGWYPDPEGGAQRRWWDGERWTEHREQPYTAALPLEQQRAPQGTSGSTTWAWLLAALHLVGFVQLLTIDPAQLATSSLEQQPSDQLATLGSSAVGWLVWGAMVVVAWLDHRELVSRGVPQPFHWAWGFLSSLVYLIGRTVVLRRRGVPGSGGPMVLAIVATVITFVGAIWAVSRAMELVLEQLPL